MIAGLAAAAALASVPPAIEQDLRCIGVFAIALSEDEKLTADEKAGITGAVMFYMGRIEGRSPGFRWNEALSSLTHAPGYVETLPADAERCAAEMTTKGNEMSSIGMPAEKPGK